MRSLAPLGTCLAFDYGSWPDGSKHEDYIVVHDYCGDGYGVNGSAGVVRPVFKPPTAISCSMPVGAATEKEIRRVAEAVVQHTTALATVLRRNGIRQLAGIRAPAG